LLPVLSSLEQAYFLALAWRKFRFVATADYYGLAKNHCDVLFSQTSGLKFNSLSLLIYAGVALIGNSATFPLRHTTNQRTQSLKWPIFQFFVTADYAGVALIGNSTTFPLRHTTSQRTQSLKLQPE